MYDQLTVTVGSDTDGTLFTADALRRDGGIWLVPSWNVLQDGKWKTPVRIVRVDQLEHQQPGPFGHDLSLAHPLPTAVLHGLAQSFAGIAYEVEEAPDIRIPFERDAH